MAIANTIKRGGGCECLLYEPTIAMTFIIGYLKAWRDGHGRRRLYVAVSAEKNSLRARRLACPTACGVKTT